MKVKVKKLHENAKIEKATDGSAGYDVYATEDADMKLLPGGVIFEYDTGLAFEVPEGYYLDARSRSSITTKTRLALGNGAGVIDSDYRGPVKFQFRSVNEVGKLYKKGDRIGQLILKKYETMDIEYVNELSKTERGTGGFGSSGV